MWSALPKPQDPPEDEGPGLPDDEEDRVIRWRWHALRAMDFSAPESWELCMRSDVVHDAAELIAHGCSHKLVVRILRP